MKKQEQIKQAKETLEKYGYYVGSLWSLPDIQDEYDCSNDVAMEILDQAIECNMSNVWDSIHIIAEDLELNIKTI